MTLEDDEMVITAAKLFRLVPTASTTFSLVDALVCVGISSDLARTTTFATRFNRQSQVISQQDGAARFDNSEDGKVKRAKDIVHLLPELDLATILTLAGWTAEERHLLPPKKGPTKLYMKVYRAKENCKKAPAPAPAPPVQTLPTWIPPIVTIHSEASEVVEVAMLSPLSVSDASSTGPPSFAAQPSAASRSTNSSNTRLTSGQAQEERRAEAEESSNKKSAHKIATSLYKAVRDGENTLKKFESAERIATEVNNWFGILAVSGRQIVEAFKNGRAGKSPPRRGPPSLVARSNCPMAWK
jgi:hypothetical protein